MHEQIKLECYIEEYRNQKKFLSARLRDKKTNKKVVLVGENLDKNHLLRFLSQAKLNQDIMPTIYEQNGEDKIIVQGYIVSNTEENIEICIDIANGGYIFA